MSNLKIRREGMTIIETIGIKMFNGRIEELDTIEERVMRVLKGQIRDPKNKAKNLDKID